MSSSKKNKLAKRKIVMTSASAAVLLSALAPVAPVVAGENQSETLSPNNFSDVYINNPHADDIRTLAQAGIAKGYPDNTFAPYQGLKMTDAVKFMGRYVEKNSDKFTMTPLANAHYIEDLALSDQEGINYANIMNRYGLAEVNVEQLLDQSELTKEHTASLLVNFMNKLKLIDVGEYVEKYLSADPIADLGQADYAYQDAIKTLAKLNISDTNYFKPKDIMMRGEFATFLVRTIDNILENPDFKDDLYAEYVFDEVKVAEDGSKIFGSGALPNSTITVKESNNNVIASTYVKVDSQYDLDIVPNLKNGERIAIEMTDHVNNKMTFEKVIRVASKDEAMPQLHVHNVMNASNDLQEDMQFDFMSGGNMANPMTPILETAVKNIIELNPSDYTVDSWEKVQIAVSNAQNILLDWEAPGDMLNNAFEQLEKAVSNLQAGEGMQTAQFASAALDILVINLLEVEKGDFTDASFDSLQNVILQAMVAPPHETVSMFNELIEAAANLQLVQTAGALEESDSEKTNGSNEQAVNTILQQALQVVVHTAKQIPGEHITEASAKQLETSIAFAQNTLAQNEGVEVLTDVLSHMIEALIDIKEAEQDGAVDELRLILTAQLDSSINLVEEDYTAESWSFFQQTIDQAKQKVNSNSANDVRTTIESIQYAISELTTPFAQEYKTNKMSDNASSYSVKKLSADSERHVVDQKYSIVDFNEVEIYELKASVQALLNDILYVVVSDTGQDVFTNALWTDVESRQSLDIAVKASRHAMYQDDITVKELEATKVLLENAIEIYDFSKKSGSVKSTTALAKELEEKIELADNLLKATESDESGEYVSVDHVWATQAMHDALNEVARQSVTVTSNTDAQLLRQQLKVLEAAIDGFLSERQIGSMAMTYSLDALNMDFGLDSDVASVTYDEHGVLDLKKMAVESKPASNVSLNDL